MTDIWTSSAYKNIEYSSAIPEDIINMYSQNKYIIQIYFWLRMHNTPIKTVVYSRENILDFLSIDKTNRAAVKEAVAGFDLLKDRGYVFFESPINNGEHIYTDCEKFYNVGSHFKELTLSEYLKLKDNVQTANSLSDYLYILMIIKGYIFHRKKGCSVSEAVTKPLAGQIKISKICEDHSLSNRTVISRMNKFKECGILYYDTVRGLQHGSWISLCSIIVECRNQDDYRLDWKSEFLNRWENYTKYLKTNYPELKISKPCFDINI